MSAFHEKSHAFIAARFYVRLTGQFGERGKQAFVFATREYAEQRGRRMALRAIRDGRDLSFATYCQYGEWVNTAEIIAADCANKNTVLSLAPDYVFTVSVCPWHSQFKEMGLPEAGEEYCRSLDAAICHGFNPEIPYVVEQTLHHHPSCIHRVCGAGLDEHTDLKKNPRNLKPFDYHCGHSYWTYNRVAAAVFGAAGETLNAAVLADFAGEYGQPAADVLAGYRSVDFNAI